MVEVHGHLNDHWRWIFRFCHHVSVSGSTFPSQAAVLGRRVGGSRPIRFVIISGFIFAEDSNRLVPLMVALALQIPWICLPAVVYRFTAGLDAFVSVESAEQEPSAF